MEYEVMLMFSNVYLSCVNFDQIIFLFISGHSEKKITGMTEAMYFSRE